MIVRAHVPESFNSDAIRRVRERPGGGRPGRRARLEIEILLEAENPPNVNYRVTLSR